MLKFIIALAVQPIFIILTKIMIEGIFFIHDEICAEINNFKRWKRQTLWDLEWEWKLLRKDFERWTTR